MLAVTFTFWRAVQLSFLKATYHSLTGAWGQPSIIWQLSLLNCVDDDNERNEIYADTFEIWGEGVGGRWDSSQIWQKLIISQFAVGILAHSSNAKILWKYFGEPRVADSLQKQNIDKISYNEYMVIVLTGPPLKSSSIKNL